MLRSYFDRLSLKQKLPLLICGLLLLVVLLDSAASYRSIRTVSEDAGRERLNSVAVQTAEILKTSVANTERAMHTTASDSALVRYAGAPTAANRPAALAFMTKPGPNPQTRIADELWSAERQLLLSTSAGPAEPHADVGAELEQASLGPRHFAIGRLRIEHDSVVVPIVGALTDKGRLLGYYVEWRRVSSTPQARDQFLKLIGPKSTMFFGNDSGSVWSDLSAVSKPPARELRGDTAVRAYVHADGTPVLGVSRAIAGSPWTVTVEFPHGTVLAAADQFVRRSALIGFVLVLFGFVVAWTLSRSITEPLVQLTDASVAVASGDFTHDLHVTRADELGKLAAAFNTMVGQVRDTKLMLEERVRERTKRLEELQVVMLRTERMNAIATMGAGLTHDLNNLLFSIALAAEQMQREEDGRGVPHGHLPTRIKSATAEASRLTKRLMAFARSEMGSMEPALIDVSAAVAAQEELLHMLLPRSIALHMHVETSQRLVLMPGTLIEQTLINLVTNAKDAMKDGGTVTVRVRDSWIDNAPFVLLEVTDTGHGIAPEIQGEIFNSFFSTKAENGTGIGLASVRALMESVGGTISVESALGKGATFRLSFPIGIAAARTSGRTSRRVTPETQRASS
jgi:signal transduction histidine kinase